MSEIPVTPTPEPNPQPTAPVTPTEAPTGGFTQADIDRIVSERLKRDREAQQAKWLENLGVTSLEDAKTALDAKRKADEAALSELEKAQAQIDAANRKATEAEQRVKDMEARILADARRSAFESAVTASGGADVKRLYVLVQAEKASEFNGLFSDDAIPDKAQMEKFIKQVQADFPNYFGTSGAGSPSASSGISPTSVQRATEEAQKEIDKKFGKL